MNSICGVDCTVCGFKEQCKGCAATCGNPFGGGCIAAQYIKAGGKENFEAFKKTLIDEFNALGVEGMPEVTELNCLCGFYVNLAYPLPNGEERKFLSDNRVYLGNQLPCLFDDFSGNERCFGLIADTGFLMVVEYGENGTEPEIVVYKRR